LKGLLKVLQSLLKAFERPFKSLLRFFQSRLKAFLIPFKGLFNALWRLGWGLGQGLGAANAFAKPPRYYSLLTLFMLIVLEASDEGL